MGVIINGVYQAAFSDVTASDDITAGDDIFVGDDLVVTDAITAASINLSSSTLVNATLDEDTLASNSATSLATQQSIKAFSDGKSSDLQMQGFVDNTETTISFDAGTYTFTLTDAGAGWSYYRDGVKHTISGNKTSLLSGTPPSTDDYYIYIDATDGTLTNSTTTWTLADTKVPVAIVRWDDTLTPKYVLLDERHTSAMTNAVHRYNHSTFGTRLESSGAISGYTLGSDVDANKQFDIAETKIWDEDLQSTLAAITGGTDDYHIAYRTGAGTWEWKEDSMPFDYTAAGYINYDNAGTMTQGQGNKYYTTYLVATNNQGLARFVIIHGQSEFSSLIAARDEQFTDLTLTGLPIAEGVCIWKFIWDTSAAYSSTGKCELDVAPIAVNTNVATTSVPPGLGTMSTQDANNVAITGGTISGLTSLGTPIVTIDSSNLAISTTTSGDIDINSVGDVDLDGVNVTVDSSSAVSIDAAAASNLSVAGAGLTIETTTSGDIDVNSAGNLDLDGATVDIDSAGAISLDAAGASNFTVAGAALTLQTTTSGDINLTSAGDIVTTGNIELTGAITVEEEVFFPISWARDGSSPPDVIEDVTSGSGVVEVRNFDSSSVEDVVFPWEVPGDIVAADGVAFSVVGLITNATAPASAEGVSFKLSGYSVGLGDALDGTFGTEVESKDDDLNGSGCTAQYDVFKTAESSTVTITDLAAGELAMLHFERDTADADDDYGQDVGVIGVVVKYNRAAVGA